MNKFNYTNLTPFKWFVLENFPFIEADFDALTEWQLFCKLGKEINKIIDSQNVVGTEMEKFTQAFIELKNYVDNYFKNLDVQEEINNKLNKMTEDGTLQEIISAYLNSKAIFGFDNVASMKNATNLIDSSYARTLGYYNKNDGGGATYKIRTITNDDVVNESTIIALNNNTLIAELIKDEKINALQLGLKNDGSTDCSTIVQDTLDDYCGENDTLYFPEGLYLFNSPINMTNCTKRNIEGNFTPNYYDTILNGLKFNSCSGFINCYENSFNGLLINGTTKNNNNGFQGRRMTIVNCSISNFNYGINGRGIFTGNTINRCYNGITACVDSRILNNTINANDNQGITLFKGCNDNIISENKIEWNLNAGIGAFETSHNVISDNVIDRNTNAGISLINCYGDVITSNNLRRNGLQTTQHSRANLYIQGCQNCVLSNNATHANNSQDDGSGTVVPMYSLEINTSSNMIIVGNNLAGGTSDNPVYYGANNINVRILDATVDRMTRYETQKTINANGGTNTFEVHCNKTGDFSQPNFHKIIATYRNVSDGDYGFLEFYVYNYKQYGKHRIKLSNDTINTYLTMTVSYNSDEDKYYITITNSSTSQDYNVKLFEY